MEPEVTSAREADANAESRQLVESYWDQFLELHPVFATQAGDERFDALLPDPTEEGLAERERVSSAALEESARIDRAVLDMEGRTALDLLESIAERELDSVRFRFDQFWSVSHLLSGHFFGPVHLLSELGAVQPVDTPDRIDRYLVRLENVPRYLEAIGEVMGEAAWAKRTAPALVVDRTIDLVEQLVAGPIEDSPAMQPLESASGDDRERVAAVLREHVIPAYRGYLEALHGYRILARETIGLSALPDGEELYAAEIRGWTTLGDTAEHVHTRGRTELEDVQGERLRIARGIGHGSPEDAIEAFTVTGKNTPGSREDVLRLARDQVRRSWEAAPRFFGHMPKENCEVRAVERYREAHILDHYRGPSADGSRPGVYFVNTAERPLHSLASTTFHEANPGHHFQAMIGVEASDRPMLRRQAMELQGLAFGEGWGLYSEQLADEMGLYENDYERLGMLELQALRAARLVVDTGIHAFGWSREQAVATLEQTGLPSWKSEAEVDRYIAMPGQALCYKLGQAEIERWRSEAAKRAGPEFDLRSFHDRLLALGPLPLRTLERELGTGED